MLISKLPCPETETPWCAEDTRVFMLCECPSAGNPTPNSIEIPAVISATFSPNVQASTKSRYYGTGGQFVSGCAGRREVSLAVRAKWCLDQPFDEDGLHGRCACFHVVPDPTKPTEYIEIFGVINLDTPQSFNNNSTDEVEWGFTVESLTPENFENMPQGQLILDCSSGGAPVHGGNVLGSWTAQDSAPSGPGEFKITAGGLQMSTVNAADDNQKLQMLNLDAGDAVFISGDNGMIELTLTAPPTIQGDIATLTGTEDVQGPRPVAGETLSVEIAPYEPLAFGAKLGEWVAQAGAPSGNGELQIDTGSVLLHGTDNLGADMSAVLADIKAGDQLHVVGQTGHLTLTASGPATESGGVYTVPGTTDETGVAPTASDGVTVRLTKLSGTPLGSWTVFDGSPDADGQFQLVDGSRLKINEKDNAGDDKGAPINALTSGTKVYVVGPAGYLVQTLSADVTDVAGTVTTLDGPVVTIGSAPAVGDIVNVRHS